MKRILKIVGVATVLSALLVVSIGGAALAANGDTAQTQTQNQYDGECPCEECPCETCNMNQNSYGESEGGKTYVYQYKYKINNNHAYGVTE